MVRNFRTSLPNAGGLKPVITAEDATQKSLDGKQVYNSKVGA